MDNPDSSDSGAVGRDPYSLVGKTVLIGITRLDHDDALIEKTEKFGRIVSVDPHSGIKIDVGERELFTLPPNPENFHDARPGRLQATLDRRDGERSRSHDDLDDQGTGVRVDATRPLGPRLFVICRCEVPRLVVAPWREARQRAGARG